MTVLLTISDVIGWIYFFSWSISFYGQVYENYKVKNVKGIAFDFLALNFTGFTFLAAYSTVGRFYPELNGPSSIEIQDIFFAYHAVIITLLTIAQVAFYFKKGDNKGVRGWCIVFLILLWGGSIGYGIFTIFYGQPLQKEYNIWFVMGYEKLAISFVKYIPQVYLNYSRKSTEGWSIFNILLDFCGGLFSFLQIVILAYANDQYSIFDGGLNIVKFGLSWIAMGFDVIFMLQHYCLYSKNNRSRVQRPLLDGNQYGEPTKIQPINPTIQNIYKYVIMAN